MIIINSRYALVGYFITSYPTRAHGIIVIYSSYTGRKNSSIVNKYCKDLNVKIIFSPFKLSTLCRILFPILLNHVLFISLHVWTVEFVIIA